jgi:3-methylfumaryl-CoA hydratase
MQAYSEWIGREERAAERVTGAMVAGLLATLDREPETLRDGLPAPQGVHWLVAAPRVAMSGLAEDGHPRLGGFLPALGLPRRMWASCELKFLHPIRIGDDVMRVSTIASIEQKLGRAGRLVFVAVDSLYRAGEAVAVEERLTLVFRARGPTDRAPTVAAPAAPRPDAGAEWSRDIVPDPVMLFRYSALTFNGHRIHYDADYTRNVEGYPGLVVHGPLTATLLLDLCERNLGRNALSACRFRAVAPVFVGERLGLRLGKQDDSRLSLTAAGPGGLAMTAEAQRA